jgi:hypothetical protein
MLYARVLFIFLFLTVFIASARAQLDPARDSRTLELVDQLKDAIQRAEKGRTDPALLQQLRELVRRYDWPWRANLLADDFTASGARLEPNWVVDRGDFRLVRGTGLRTIFTMTDRGASPRREESSGLDILGGIIRGITEPAGQSAQPAAPSSGEIYTNLRISNAFALSMQMTSRTTGGDGRLELGPYRGRERNSGYRLAYNPGKRTSFELLRLSAGRSSVVEVYDGYADLEDGRTHAIEWRRAPDGDMAVLLDGKEIIRTLDRASADEFDGFGIVNSGGEYTVGRVEIFGATR